MVSPAVIAPTAACLLSGALVAAVGERRITAANPLRRLRFHWSTPADPPMLPASCKLLQVASMGLLAIGAGLLMGTSFLPWFAVWMGLAVIFNLLPRGAVLAQHNRTQRGTD